MLPVTGSESLGHKRSNLLTIRLHQVSCEYWNNESLAGIWTVQYASA
jgi:hypothetical protein